MLTRKQHELLTYIQDRLQDTGVSPSFEEMKEALALKSKSGVHRLISALEERGLIRRLPNRARSIEVIDEPARRDVLSMMARPAFRLGQITDDDLLAECFRRGIVQRAA